MSICEASKLVNGSYYIVSLDIFIYYRQKEKEINSRLDWSVQTKKNELKRKKRRRRRRRRKKKERKKEENITEKKTWVSEGHNIEEKDACTHAPLE